MAVFTYKVLGVSAPADTNNANLYTAPAGTEAVVSTLAISNVTGSAVAARVFIRVGGAAAAIGNALVYDTPIAANSTTALSLGITLAATDIITVRSATGAALSFFAFGSEIN
jgi:hypothetical protein